MRVRLEKCVLMRVVLMVANLIVRSRLAYVLLGSVSMVVRSRVQGMESVKRVDSACVVLVTVVMRAQFVLLGSFVCWEVV